MTPDDKLKAAVEAAVRTYNALPADQRAEMDRLQRESWQRAFAPCEHGDPDWETCSQCLAALKGSPND
jgi:hypothetical protein